MPRTFPLIRGLAVLGVSAALSAGLAFGQAPSARRTTPPPAHVHTVRCTIIDGNPYSVTIEHGACDLGVSP